MMSIYSINTYELPKGKGRHIPRRKRKKNDNCQSQIQDGPIVSVLYAKAQHYHTTPHIQNQ